MAQYLTDEEAKHWAFSNGLSKEDNVSALLTKLAIFRQARMGPGGVDELTLDLYTQVLAPLDLRAFQVAMKNLAYAPRQEGEPAFPSMGMILEQMDAAREVFPNFKDGATSVDDRPVFMAKQNLQLMDGHGR
ncbi:MAG TPA: hypothetical protein VFW94_23805 [Candidatus Acidoferrales bacterium]|nr:hypothetical protein [Candidatus Acidoferrales bacterium]